MKKHTIRLLTLLLAAVMLFAAFAVPAAALTARQEKKLQSAQRSINNPTGDFTVPETKSIFRMCRVVNKDTCYTAHLVVCDLAKHPFKREKGEAKAVMAYVPVVKKSDKLPANVELTVKEVAKRMLSGGMNNFYFALQETDKKDIYNVISIYYNWKGEPAWTSIKVTYDAKTGVLQGLDAYKSLKLGL